MHKAGRDRRGIERQGGDRARMRGEREKWREGEGERDSDLEMWQ